MKAYHSLLAAIRFLTVLPAPSAAEWDEKTFGLSALWYPLVGGLIGLIVAGLYRLFALFLPLQLAAILTLIGWVGLSGGLHWDGLSDCCDGFFFAGTPEKRLTIMKDVHHGTYAVLGVVLLLLLKAACVAQIAPAESLWLFPLAASLARWGILILIHQPVVNPQGMATMLKRAAPAKAWLVGVILPAALLAMNWRVGVLILAVALLHLSLLGLLAKKKIGGINGDVLGMGVETTEIVVLLIFCLLKFNGW